MRKTIILVLLLTVIMVNGIFASGQKGGSYISPSGMNNGSFEQYQNLQLITLTGTLELINGQPPYLIADKSRFYIMAPYQLLNNIDVKDGETVTVSGYEMPSGMWQWNNNERGIRIIQATIKGETIDIPYYDGRMSMMGGRRMMRGSRNNMNGYYDGMGCW